MVNTSERSCRMMILSECSSFFQDWICWGCWSFRKEKIQNKKENKLSGGKFPETLTTRLDLDIYISLLGKYYYSFVSESIRKNNGKLTFACYPDDRFTPTDSQLLMKWMKQHGRCRLDSRTVHRRSVSPVFSLGSVLEVFLKHSLFRY